MLYPDVPFAAEGPKLPPAQYKPLPVGTIVRYDTWSFTVKRVYGFDSFSRTNENLRLHSYAVFGKHGNDAYSRSSSGNTTFTTELDDAAKKAFEKLWPLEVGKRTVVKFQERISHFNFDGYYGWTLSLEVMGTEYLKLNGSEYGTYVIHEHASAPEVHFEYRYYKREYSEVKWYHPPSGLVLRTERGSTSYELKSVEFPSGTTTHALSPVVRR